MKQGSSGLTVRELRPNFRPSVELSTKKIQRWVEELPAANLSDSSRSTYRLLVETNQSILNPELRFSILNLLEPIARRLSDALEKKFISKHIALTEKQKKIAALVQAIQTELSLGYHATIESLLIEDSKKSTKKLLAAATGMAVKYHGLIILRCYQLYASVPNRLWRELYSLYQLAIRNNIEKMTFKVPRQEFEHSVKSNFTQILLMSIANPYQLRQKEIETLWTMLPAYIELVSLEAHAFNKHHFIIDLNSAKAPILKSLYSPSDGESCIKLSVSGLVERFKKEILENKKEQSINSEKSMIYKHLLHCWNQGTQRNFARTACNDPIRVTIGLATTHFLLTENEMRRNANLMEEPPTEGFSTNKTLDAMEGSLKNATLTEMAEEKSKLEASLDRNYLSTSAETSKDVWAKLYRPEQEKKVKEVTVLTGARSRDSIVRDAYRIQTCSLVNISPGGYCIQLSADELPKNAQTGEILGFVDTASDGFLQWSIGVVRWVKRQVKDNTVQMGIQLLAPDAKSINIQLKNSRGQENKFQRSLLLPALTGVGLSATVITNPLSFTLNSKVCIAEYAEEYMVRLSKEVSSSASFRQFAFDKISTHTALKKPKLNAINKVDPDLDGVWDLI
ncbi:MAG: hypothetical protein COB38_00055 [Gammaproteobacteria bacterium]|nr:MAG: hypothetical protein COB38_00055 [Gammaproteobacteria bacterium]